MSDTLSEDGAQDALIADTAVGWLRKQIEARASLARGAVELGSSTVWAVLGPGILATGQVAQEDPWPRVCQVGEPLNGQLMAANDPQDTLARCEAELAIVGLCARVVREDEGQEYYSDGWAGLGVAKIVLGGIASAYRHRDGYAEHWGSDGQS